MISCLNTSARVIVLHRPLKTEMEYDFSRMAFFICFTVKLYEKTVFSRNQNRNTLDTTLSLQLCLPTVYTDQYVSDFIKQTGRG
jgi:hypothetical protein